MMHVELVQVVSKVGVCNFVHDFSSLCNCARAYRFPPSAAVRKDSF